jgi:hypothetical protein
VLNQRSLLLIKVCAKLKVKCFLIRYFSYTQNVTGHAKRRQCNHKTTEKMNGNANASAKSKELQPTAQADTVAAHLLLPNRTAKTNNTLKDKK